MFAAYMCKHCDAGGLDPEESPGVVRCWICGLPAAVTARFPDTIITAYYGKPDPG